MLSFEQMLWRLVVALLFGAILGVERELVGKEAGVRTEMLVAGGSAIFTMIGLIFPSITAGMAGATPDAAARDSAVALIANVVVGIGFLGAGLIVKQHEHPRGITTAALVWATAAIGILVGIGQLRFALASVVLITLLLYLMRKLNISERLERHPEVEKQ